MAVTDPREDFALLEAWRAGDESSGQRLFGRHLDTLYRFFHNKTSGDIDDLVQETMMACLKSQEAFEQRSSFKSYLLGIARFRLYEHYRSAARDGARLEFDTVTLHDLDPTPSRHVADRAEEQLLLTALRHLPINAQIALELTYWEDMPAPAVAEVLGIPVDTVYSRLRRAKEMLKEKLERLARTREQLEWTQTDLQVWAQAMRDKLGGPGTTNE
jgi:RNA polymerase sigma factor (sigma-70 family)